MTTTDTPIAREIIGDTCPGDTFANVRDMVAVLAAAVSAPYPWDRAGEGIIRLLAIVDSAIAYEMEQKRPWERPEEAV